MIDANSIETAERLLRVVTGDGGMDVPRQFEHYSVERSAYENFHQEQMSLVIRRAQQLGIAIPRTLIPVLNTIMVHHFLVGVVCGREAGRVV